MPELSGLAAGEIPFLHRDLLDQDRPDATPGRLPGQPEVLYVPWSELRVAHDEERRPCDQFPAIDGAPGVDHGEWRDRYPEEVQALGHHLVGVAGVQDPCGDVEAPLSQQAKDRRSSSG